MGNNMKKWICLMMGVVLLLAGCGTPNTGTSANTVQLYYVNTGETKVEMHEHDLKATELESQLGELVAALSLIPDKLEYKPPFSFGFSLLDYEVEDGRLQLNVDANYKNLKATTEVLVRAALVRSFTQLKGVSYVLITVEGEQLHDSLGNVIGIMSGDQFIDNDGNEINTYEMVRLRLYFADEEGTKLVAINRTMAYNTNISLERLVVEQILAGPSEELDSVYPTMNPDTKLVSITTKDGICYVNLDQTFLTPVYNTTPEVAIYSIVNSLTELTGINKVQILINGDDTATYRESYNLSTIFERNLNIL